MTYRRERANGGREHDGRVQYQSTAPVRGLPDYWQHFLVCILFHFLLPLLPLVALWFMDQHITEQEFLLTAAIYLLAIGTSSKSKLILALSIVIAMLFTAACGRHAGPNAAMPVSEKVLTVIAFVVVILPHLVERYNRHVVSLIPFMES